MANNFINSKTSQRSEAKKKRCDGSVERHAQRDEEERPAGDSGMVMRKASIRFEED